ncbi:hypothetical protein C8R44DRAFT_1794 [Mycena epipterygia]|nr:hypothetical protein C8R44DRAFT_1794 [Mycena epipterygia]
MIARYSDTYRSFLSTVTDPVHLSPSTPVVMNSPTVVFSDLEVVNYIKAAFLSLLVYDTLLQLSEEYLHIWKSRWTLIKCLYLWTRYSTFISTIASLVDLATASSSTCNKVTTFVIVFSGFGIVILMVRTYTLYERSKKLLAFFFLMWFSVGGIAFWAVTRWTFSANFTSPNASGLPSCYFSTTSGIGIGLVCYLSLLVGESIIVLLTLWKLFRKFYHHKSGLLRSLYRDGVWFYLAILPFTGGTVLVLFLAPPGLNNIANAPVQVMHTILVCRLVTHAREMAAEDDRRAYASNRIPKARCELCADHVIDISPENKV